MGQGFSGLAHLLASSLQTFCVLRTVRVSFFPDFPQRFILEEFSIITWGRLIKQGVVPLFYLISLEDFIPVGQKNSIASALLII